MVGNTQKFLLYYVVYYAIYGKIKAQNLFFSDDAFLAFHDALNGKMKLL